MPTIRRKYPVTGGGGGGSNTFGTIQTPAGTSPVADSTTDTLTLVSGDSSITITGDATTDTIDIRAVGGGGSGGSFAFVT
jgi:hypothetical protein